jgi:hypothetical protein
MKLPPKGTFDSVASTYVVANTPMFLYKHLRNDPTVFRISTDFDTSEILELLNYYADGPGSRRHESLAAAYAFLVSLSFKPAPEFEKDLRSFESPHLRWLAPIKDLILAENPTRTVQINIPLMQIPRNVETAQVNRTVTGIPLTPTIRSG